MKFCRTKADQSAIYSADLVKARVASVACILVTLSVTGCGLDGDVIAACRVERISGSHLTRHVDQAACRRAQQRAANEKARLAGNRRDDAERARRSRDAAARSQRRLQELNAYNAMTPAQQREVRARKRKEQEKLRATAARKQDARRKKAKKEFDRRQNTPAARKAVARWARERQLARRDNGANLRKYPHLAWLSGYWCAVYVALRERYEILDQGHIRVALYHPATRYNDPKFIERTYTLQGKGTRFKGSNRILYRLIPLGRTSISRDKYGGAGAVTLERVRENRIETGFRYRGSRGRLEFSGRTKKKRCKWGG